MTHLNHVLFAKDGSTFDLSQLPDGILAIFTGSITSKSATHFISQIEDQYHVYNNAGVNVYFSTQDTLESNSKTVLLDLQNEFGLQCPVIGKFEQQCDALMLFEKIGDGINHLLTREHPEPKYDWITYIIGFATNFQTATPDSSNYWRHGQKVLIPGDYMCVDCGYIMSLGIESVFPTCEVCFSGDPEGPTDGPEQGYWEKI
jgi:hypothetical protein